MTNIQNFKMSLYLQLSCSHRGHWLLPSVLLLSLLVNLASWLYCGHLQPQPTAPALCMNRTINRIFQILLGLTLIAYFTVLADLFTQKMKRLMVAADTEGGLALVRDRLRALLVRGNNSVSPVMEINLNGHTGNNNFSTVVDNDQNQNGLKDHIR